MKIIHRNLLLIVIKRISEIELNIMNDFIEIPHDNTNLFLIFKKNFNIIISWICDNLTTK